MSKRRKVKMSRNDCIFLTVMYVILALVFIIMLYPRLVVLSA